MGNKGVNGGIRTLKREERGSRFENMYFQSNNKTLSIYTADFSPRIRPKVYFVKLTMIINQNKISIMLKNIVSKIIFNIIFILTKLYSSAIFRYKRTDFQYIFMNTIKLSKNAPN